MNELNFPREEDVDVIDFGHSRVAVIEVTPENKDYLMHVALMMYVGEPCRICGETITEDQVHDIVYAGYGKLGRSAHGSCWDKYPGQGPEKRIPAPEWVDQENEE